MMRDKRPNATHLGLEMLNEFQIMRKITCGLIGGSYHKAASNRISNAAKVLQALETIL